ncbi:hypothetical protein Dsin_022264 [Dipteronia sinensis]|uniref:FAR1 domain-containing protein n=1 Tax=Dipteronia sinensis TaxID=43782 RepID=A0AAE0DZW8_9ROSI|nr:hypothetical protein Dsin_022264 [Dipteronia sinensis]
MEVIHGEIDDKLIPKVGMKFQSEDEAYDFYNAYAYRVGFSIQKSKGYKGKDGTMINRIFSCSYEGYPEKNKKDVNVNIHRAETRFGCLAKMEIDCRQIGKYQLTPTQSAEKDLADSCGIAPEASCDMMARGVGGCENLGFIPRDCRNYLRTIRTTQMR